MSGRITRRGALALPLLAAGAASAQQEFPSRPVTVIVPFPPGGATDLIARPLGAALQKVWGQSVILQNRGGAGGGIGMVAGGAARPDGYTALIAHVSYSSIPAADALFGRPPSFDRTTLSPVALLTADPLVIVVRDDAPWRTWLDYVADAKRRPGEIAYGSSGPYSAVHLPFEMLAQAGEMRLNHVPYSGGGPAMTAVLGGQVSATASVPSVVNPFLRGGQMRALVHTGAQRVALLPDCPTAIELGFPTVEFYLWVGLFTQAGVEPGIQRRLREGVAAALREPEMLRQLDTTGMVVDHREGAAFQAFLDADRVRIEAAIQRIGRVE
ncbi:MAG: Tat pathway signal protein [Rhodospirillales bacterium]|jgi:tripartite-type tricarboxylate transporter receptor subunit TctC|nr:Tat pathway signal protein [Rhodospirillales bacterium]